MLYGKFVDSPVRHDQQSVLPGMRGVPWWGAVAIAGGFTVVGAVISGSHGPTGSAFKLFYVVGCVFAVLAVRRRALFTAAAQTPLVLFGVALVSQYILKSSTAEGIKGVIINVALPVAKIFPLMAWTFVVVLILALARFLLTKSLAAQESPNDAAKPARRTREARRDKPKEHAEPPTKRSSRAATASGELTPRTAKINTRAAPDSRTKPDTRTKPKAASRTEESTPRGAQTTRRSQVASPRRHTPLSGERFAAPEQTSRPRWTSPEPGIPPQPGIPPRQREPRPATGDVPRPEAPRRPIPGDPRRRTSAEPFRRPAGDPPHRPSPDDAALRAPTPESARPPRSPDGVRRPLPTDPPRQPNGTHTAAAPADLTDVWSRPLPGVRYRKS